MRSAMKRWFSWTIMRSCSADRNQVGRSFHSGRPTATVMQAGEIGRWTAASTASSSLEAFCANAAAKASSGR